MKPLNTLKAALVVWRSPCLLPRTTGDSGDKMPNQRREDMLPGDTVPISTRREFLRRAAIATALVSPAAFTGCHVLGAAGKNKLDFGDDFGLLNLMLVLETTEVRFYERVISAPPRDLRPGEFEILRDIKANERQHLRFLKRALGPLRVKVPASNFSSVDFTSRRSVLETARNFEDNGVATLNGAGRRVKLPEFLTIAGKLVSVEGRHAASLRDMLNPGSRDFAGDDVVDENGLDRAITPDESLRRSSKFLVNPPRIVGI